MTEWFAFIGVYARNARFVTVAAVRRSTRQSTVRQMKKVRARTAAHSHQFIGY